MTKHDQSLLIKYLGAGVTLTMLILLLLIIPGPMMVGEPNIFVLIIEVLGVAWILIGQLIALREVET